MYSLPSSYMPPSNGIVITNTVQPFYPNMIQPTVSYLSPQRLNPYIQQVGIT